MSETDLANIFHNAADAGDINKLRECLEIVGNAVDVNCCGKKNYMALHKACSKGHLECVKYLLEKGANVNAHADGKISPLHLATEGGQAEIVEVLIEKSADVNQCTSRGNDTPLHWLVKNEPMSYAPINVNPPGKSKMGEKERILDILHHNGAKLDLQNEEGSTALHLACHHEEYDKICERLLQLGAKTNINDKDMMTYVDLVKFNNRSKEQSRNVSENVTQIGSLHDIPDGQGQRGIPVVGDVQSICSVLNLSDLPQSPGDVEADGPAGRNRTGSRESQSTSTQGNVTPYVTADSSPNSHVVNVIQNFAVNINVSNGGVCAVGDNTSLNVTTSPTSSPTTSPTTNTPQLEVPNESEIRELETA